MITKKNRRATQERLRKLVKDLKEATPCKDCQTKYPYYVMQYDHRDGSTKEGIVSSIVNTLGEKALLREIAKCDLVCSNCHAIRTHTRAGAV